MSVFLMEDGVQLFEMGEGVEIEVPELPHAMQGLVVAKVAQSSHLTFLTSNGVVVDFKGAGYFAVERFEQQSKFAPGWLSSNREDGQSRMILNLRSGTLVVDQSKLGDASLLTVESPIGRFSISNNAFWMMEIERDQRKRTYSFNVYCLSGTVRYFDLMGRSFTIGNGQRISGAGSALTPSVEVAELTADAEEYLEEYEMRAELLTETTISETDVVAATKDVVNAHTTEVLSESMTPKPESETFARPIAIEYAPRAAPVSPFRGVAKPPSTVEADLF
ncbi:MAG: hypothetical protein ACSHYA_00980 [Opitutaceae bacterium]